jgi:hypothetical protein
MDIQSIIQENRAAVAALFADYGINHPVNYDTLSAAIALHSEPHGNAFLNDLMDRMDENNYDEILGFGKKAKARREERKATGQKTKLGGFIQNVGAKLKGKPSNKEAAINMQSGENTAPLIKEAKGSDVANDGTPATKLGGFIDTAANLVNTAQGVYNQLVPKPVDNGDLGDGGPYVTDAKKWYQNPMILVGIGAGVLVLITVMVFAFKGKKA